MKWSDDWALTAKIRHYSLIVIIALWTAGCTSDMVATPLPTLALIPATATRIPTAVPASATPDPALFSPEALLTREAAITATPSAPDDRALDPIAQELVALAQQRVADLTGLPLRRIRVDEVTPYRWTDSSLGCPLPEQTYVDIAIDGYRILLTTGDNSYVYHTDFDRVLPCPEGSEVLPDD
jgi:hypothetical protein